MNGAADPDQDGPLHIRPGRTEPRGEFPVHDDQQASYRRPLTAAAAKARATQRLADWRREHGRR